ncbi:hypothetical protein [Archangium sp.]|jgi:hypothetical protein|uniref:hypothetical protein n=1 Tax=Archangium sp. TaxID=1872627 RepID=UPI002EDA7453
MSFEQVCRYLKAKHATRPPPYVGIAIRFNGDDDNVFMVENEEYDQEPNGELFGQYGRTRQTITQLAPFQPYDTVQRYINSTSSRHEELRRSAREKAIKAMDFEFELNMLQHEKEHKDRLAAGLLMDRNKVREELRKKAESDSKAFKHLPPISEARKHAEEVEARRAYQKNLYQETIRYAEDEHPHEVYAHTPINPAFTQGGHAEEILIREWKSMTQGLKVEKVDLYLTTMCCAMNSSPFQMYFDGVLVDFKQGCINKMVQLVELVGADVTWNITYTNLVGRDELGLALRFAKRFPINVTYSWERH